MRRKYCDYPSSDTRKSRVSGSDTSLPRSVRAVSCSQTPSSAPLNTLALFLIDRIFAMHPAKLLREHTVCTVASIRGISIEVQCNPLFRARQITKRCYIYILKSCPLARRLFLLVALTVVVVVVVVVIVHSRCGCAGICLVC